MSTPGSNPCSYPHPALRATFSRWEKEEAEETA